ncbi:hypothetical protein ABPG75_005338 [Micractinium tetrahymenae]
MGAGNGGALPRWAGGLRAPPCQPGLLLFLRQALRGIRTTARTEDLWCRMLEELGGSEQGRTNLSRLLREHPDALPDWVLFSLGGPSERLMADGSEVFLRTSAVKHGFLPLGVALQPLPKPKKKRRRRRRYSSCSDDDYCSDAEGLHESAQLSRLAAEQQQRWRPKSAEQREQELAAALTAGRAAAAAASEAADGGFLLRQPPLPLQLLRGLDAGGMLALGQTCRALRCLSFEQLRREEAALFCEVYSYLRDGWPQHYEPLQLGSAQAGSAGGGPAQRVPTAAERRRMRCLALLCGLAEATAQRWRQHRAGGSRSDRAEVASDKYEIDDAFSLFFKAQVLPGMECLRGGSSDGPALLFIAEGPTLQQLIVQAERSASDELQQKLLPVARAAASRGEALCMHYFHWPKG